jgi:MFS family permease
MVRDVGGTHTEAFWVGTAYLIASAVSMPLFASLSDTFGRRPPFIAAIALFIIGTGLCSPAQSITLLLGGRGVQGVGGGGMYVLCLVVFTDIVPPRLHPKWYAVV